MPSGSKSGHDRLRGIGRDPGLPRTASRRQLGTLLDLGAQGIDILIKEQKKVLGNDCPALDESRELYARSERGTGETT